MADYFIINDSLNLKDFISFTTEYIRENGTAEDRPRNILQFLSMVLTGLPSDIDGNRIQEDSLIKDIQKIFSGNIPSSKIDTFVHRLKAREFDSTLVQNLSPISATLIKITDSPVFFEFIQKKLNLRFFSDEEINTFDALLEQELYCEYLLQLLKHGFFTMYNIPCFFADRIYDEALTYDYDSPLRYSLMNIAAKQGNKRASLEYGNYLAKKGPYLEAFRYLMLAIPLPAAIWNIAYLIESHVVESDCLRQFKQTIKIDDKLDSDEYKDRIFELSVVSCTDPNPSRYDALMYAYKTYFYLSLNGYFKAYNSMAKMIMQGKIRVYDQQSGITGDFLVNKYSRCAISGSSIVSLCNESSRLLKSITMKAAYEPEDKNNRLFVELATIAAEAKMYRAYYNLAQYYEHAAEYACPPPKSRDEIRKLYEEALALDIDKSFLYGTVLLRLGILANDPAEKREYYQQAISYKNFDAAFYLAFDLLSEYKIDNDYQKKFRARILLNENIPYMSGSVRAMAVELQQATKQ